MQEKNLLRLDKYFPSTTLADILEAERAKLERIVTRYGIASRQALRQSRVLDNIILMKMRKRHKRQQVN